MTFHLIIYWTRYCLKVGTTRYNYRRYLNIQLIKIKTRKNNYNLPRIQGVLTKNPKQDFCSRSLPPPPSIPPSPPNKSSLYWFFFKLQTGIGHGSLTKFASYEFMLDLNTSDYECLRVPQNRLVINDEILKSFQK